jgi:AcrR family transcriptional regulator
MASASTADPTSRPPAQRLRDALVRLTVDNTSEATTASALCAFAGVSRNALYRYHPDILQELHELQRQRHCGPGSARRDLQQLRDENKDLCQQVTHLASLVDHYFAAWQETSSMLQRRERELADLRKCAKPKLVSIRN